VNFALAIAAVWAVLLLAPQGFAAATGAVNNTKVIICTGEATDTGADKRCNSGEVKSQVFLSGPSRCCEQSRNHTQTPESCQTPCPASGCALSANQVWQLPIDDLLALKLVPRVIGARNSLLHQRLNRPPITDRLA
jgi:hypothetical protein